VNTELGLFVLAEVNPFRQKDPREQLAIAACSVPPKACSSRQTSATQCWWNGGRQQLLASGAMAERGNALYVHRARYELRKLHKMG
jgi:hypothetical protein